MKVLVLTALEYPHLGGVSTHIGQLINGLKSSGHQVEIVSRSDLGLVKNTFMKILAGLCYFSGNKEFGYLIFHKLTGYFLYRKIKNKIKQIDVIHLHSPSFVTEHLSQNSYIVTCHADMVPEMIGQKKLSSESYAAKVFEKMEKSVYQRARKVIAVDGRLKNFVESLVQRSDVIIMKNFIEVEQDFNGINNKQDVFKVLCPRRLVVKNGVEYAIRAFTLLDNQFQLLIAGNGEDEKKLKDLVDSLNLKNIYFLGAKSPEEIKQLHKEVNAIVIPSITVNGLQEATSLSALEGFHYGVPVVASDIGGLSEMITDDDNGLLFPEKDYEKLAVQLKRLFSDPGLCFRLAKNGHENLKENYSVNSRIKEIEKIYAK